MSAAEVIKTVKKKGLRPIKLMSHGWIFCMGAMFPIAIWERRFDRIAKINKVAGKRKPEYLKEMKELEKYYKKWYSNYVKDRENKTEHKKILANKEEDKKKRGKDLNKKNTLVEK